MLAFKQALHACITSQRIPDGFLKVVRPCLIPLHDLRDERSPARAVSIRVMYHRGHLCEKILRAVFSEFHRPQIQRSIFAVEQINILIVLLHGQWEYGLRVFQHRVTVLAKLELFDTVDEPLSGVLFRDLQRKQIQFIRQQLCKLCYLYYLHRNSFPHAALCHLTSFFHFIIDFFIARQQARIQIAATIYTQARLRTSLFCFLLYQPSLWWVKHRAQGTKIFVKKSPTRLSIGSYTNLSLIGLIFLFIIRGLNLTTDGIIPAHTNRLN